MFDTIAMILMAVLAGGALLLGYGRHQRLKGAEDKEDEANADTIKRRKAGQEAVREGRDSGLSADERVRRAVDDLTD